MKTFCADYRQLEDLVPVVRAFGCGIEVQDFCKPDNLERPGLARTIRQSIPDTIELSVHGPYSELCPATRDRAIREVTARRMSEALEVARVLEARRVVFHSGYIPKTYPADVWMSNSLAFWREFLGDNDVSVDIFLENVYEDDWTLLKELVDRIDDRRVAICLDVGHANANSTRRLDEWVTNLGRRIGYVHLHNNHGTYDDHNGLENGTIRMTEVLDAITEIAPEACWSLETFADSPQNSLEWLRAHGYQN